MANIYGKNLIGKSYALQKITEKNDMSNNCIVHFVGTELIWRQALFSIRIKLIELRFYHTSGWFSNVKKKNTFDALNRIFKTYVCLRRGYKMGNGRRLQSIRESTINHINVCSEQSAFLDLMHPAVLWETYVCLSGLETQ